MTRIDAALERLESRVEAARADFNDPAKPFQYMVLDEFLPASFADEIAAEYPDPDSAEWCDDTFVHQRHKLTKSSGFSGAIADFFDLTANARFLELISRVADIEDLRADPSLLGGGLHQSLAGGFLDVHVDFNFHPETKEHRRLNLLLYLNPDWREEYGGCLELWDMQRKTQIEHITPEFNRAVMFATSEVSFHGHPKPITDAAPSRRSLAVYYYTETRDAASTAPEHNTLYKQTTGLTGYVKTGRAGARALLERAKSSGLKGLPKVLANKAAQIVTGKGNPNR